MVRASTAIVVAFALAPVFAAPLTEEISQDIAARTFDETPAELEARKFKLGKVFKKFKGIAKMAANVVAPGAGAFIPRDVVEEGSLTDFEAREPEPEPINTRPGHPNAPAPHPHHAPHPGAPHHGLSAHHGPAGAHKHAGAQAKGHGKGPKAKHGKKGSKKHSSKKGGKKGGKKGSKKPGHKGPKSKVPSHKKLSPSPSHKSPSSSSSHKARPPHPRSLDETEDLSARFADLESTLADLIERGFLEVVEDGGVEAREPRFKLGNILRKVKNVATKSIGVAGKVVNAANALGLREDMEDMEFEARDFEVEELDAEAREFDEDIMEEREDAEELDARFDESSFDELD